MGAFLHRGEYGFWASNGARNSFLDWFAETRCAPDDPRRVRCLDGSLRWMGCCPDLAELLPVGTALEVTPDEMEEARARDPHLAQVLKMVDLVTSGAWKHGADSDEAVWWAVPWMHPGHFTQPAIWSEECLDLHLDFERPEADRLVEAATALWSHKHLQGCWLDHEREPEAATRLDAPFFSRSEIARWGPPDFEGPPPLYGLARVHGRYVLPCAACLGLGEDYMFLSLSFRAPALRRSMPGEIEPEGACGPKMFSWLAEVGRHVHARVPIRAAVLGWEPTVPSSRASAIQTGKFEPPYGYLLPRGTETEYVAPTHFSRP